MIILTRGCSLFLVSNVPAPSIDLLERVPGMLGMLRIPRLCTLHYPAKRPYMSSVKAMLSGNGTFWAAIKVKERFGYEGCRATELLYIKVLVIS